VEEKYPDKHCLDTPVRTPIRSWIAVDPHGPQKTKSLELSRPIAAVGTLVDLCGRVLGGAGGIRTLDTV
jgi:hypothetical protein